MRNKALVLTFILIAALSAFAADTVLTWPAEGQPTLKFVIGKLRQVNSYSGQTDYVAEVQVTNASNKAVPFASFYVYLLDKTQKRIGEGYIEVSNVGPGQQVKVPFSAHAMGNIASMQLQPQHLPTDEPRKVAMQITSVPAGATLKIDGQEAGVTPASLQMLPGKHVLEFSKEGFSAGSTPIEIAAGALPGSVNFELAGLKQDTIVLRDGGVLLGDVTGVTMNAVTVRVNGKVRSLQRNQVARLLFVERTTAVKKASTRKK
jgi:hypothetical protein